MTTSEAYVEMLARLAEWERAVRDDQLDYAARERVRSVYLVAYDRWQVSARRELHNAETADFAARRADTENVAEYRAGLLADQRRFHDAMVSAVRDGLAAIAEAVRDGKGG